MPLIWFLILYVPALVLFREELFTTATPRMDASLTLSFGMLGFFLAQLTVAVWSFVVFIKCLAEVQSFSAWKALGSVLLTALLAGMLLLMSLELLVW